MVHHRIGDSMKTLKYIFVLLWLFLSCNIHALSTVSVADPTGVIDADKLGNAVTSASITAAGGLLADDSALTGDPTLTDATPTFIVNDSDNAAGTFGFFANSSGGANDITFNLGVEDSTGASTNYFTLNGVDETVDIKKTLTFLNGGVLRVATTTNDHNFLIQAYTSGGWTNAIEVKNDTGSALPEITLTGNISLPQLLPVSVIGDPDSMTIPARQYTNGGTIKFNAPGTFAVPAVAAGLHFTTINMDTNAVLMNPDATGTEDTIKLYKPSAGTIATLTQGQALSFASKIGACVWEADETADYWFVICTADVVGE
jgi:hypothetical protein